MRKRLLDILRCPVCKGPLRAITFDAGPDGSVTNGLLVCSCKEEFPIINFVPRLLVGGLLASAMAAHPEFQQRLGRPLRAPSSSGATVEDPRKFQTQASFGYEWTEFSRYDADNFSLFVRPLPEGFFRGKVGLDVGCGAGRHVQYATGMGAEVIGLDVSLAVEAAARRNEGNPLAHFVQADIFTLPFQRESFDFIYSLGVLHHLPAPETGFQLLLPYLKPDGLVFLWVYLRTRRKEWLEYVRWITTRLPFPLVKCLAWIGAVVDYGLVVNVYRLLCHFRSVEQLAPLRIKDYARTDFYTSYTDWFDRLSAPISHYFTEEEIRRVCERAGLSQIETAQVGDSWVWAAGRRGSACISS
jgi:SAM-dependent methyltransferase/uncharacterized protein YbaR (Trm112 family)